jgi:peptidoglycan/LPS O-acetylase OafA/YrhL
MLAPLFVRMARVVPLDGTVTLMIYLIVTLGAPWAIARWFDSPVRARLTDRFAPRAPVPVAQSAP